MQLHVVIYALDSNTLISVNIFSTTTPSSSHFFSFTDLGSVLMAHGSKSDSGHFFAITRHDEYFLSGGDLYLMVTKPSRDHRDDRRLTCSDSSTGRPCPIPCPQILL